MFFVFLTLTFVSSIARYSNHALYEVSELNPHITSSEFYTGRLGFQHTSAGTAGKLHCSNPSEQLLLVPPNRSSALHLSQVKPALGAAVPPPKKRARRVRLASLPSWAQSPLPAEPTRPRPSPHPTPAATPARQAGQTDPQLLPSAGAFLTRRSVCAGI